MTRMTVPVGVVVGTWTCIQCHCANM